MLQLTTDELQKATAQLDQAIYNHEQWYKNLQRVLIARLPPDAADLEGDAHHRCRFGQWYDGQGADLLGGHEAFAALGEAHKQMHDGASRLLQRSADDLPISVSDLDQFNNLLDRLRLELQSLRGELVEMAQNRDPLTGVRNRTSLLVELREQQALVNRGAQQCAVIMVDLDHFKEINDRDGHAVGDAVLAATARCLHTHLRAYDRIYRYGGEEFLVSMPQVALATAVEAAERLREAVAAQEIDTSGSPAVKITASLGVAALEAGLPVEEAIDRADKALYRAKAAGRNRVETSSA
jgi:diguanylate cyclase